MLYRLNLNADFFQDEETLDWTHLNCIRRDIHAELYKNVLEKKNKPVEVCHGVPDKLSDIRTNLLSSNSNKSVTFNADSRKFNYSPCSTKLNEGFHYITRPLKIDSLDIPIDGAEFDDVDFNIFDLNRSKPCIGSFYTYLFLPFFKS